MNECTEMYASKGVEHTFSFLHLSLQEYLAAWHLAKSYSVEFQVAYHRLAVGSYTIYPVYQGGNKEEEALISLLEGKRLSLVEPAIFLAGITGWRCQLGDNSNHWGIYISQDTVDVEDCSVLLQSVYETQNPNIISLYFSAENTAISRNKFVINPSEYDTSCKPYYVYALSYSLAHSKQIFSFTLEIRHSDDISLVETFVRGLNDHCKSTAPTIKHLQVRISTEIVTNCLFWLLKANFLTEIESVVFRLDVIGTPLAYEFIKSLVQLKSLEITLGSCTCWKWFAALNFLSQLKILHICVSKECSPLELPIDRHCLTLPPKVTDVVFYINFPSNSAYDMSSQTDKLIGSVLKSVNINRSSHITKLVLPNISRETMRGVYNILLHCPSLATLELRNTKLGYDGILFIFSTLRTNSTLKHLMIHETLELPSCKTKTPFSIGYSFFKSMKIVPLSSKITCTSFLLSLNNILRHNTSLKDVQIQCGLFLPLTTGGCRECYQWTGLGPLSQFNLGAISRGTPPNIRRSFSSSNLTEPQTNIFWWRQYMPTVPEYADVCFNNIFSRKKPGERSFSLLSFTAPDTDILQSFSGLDPRLKECLGISDLHQYKNTLIETYYGMMNELSLHSQLNEQLQWCSLLYGILKR